MFFFRYTHIPAKNKNKKSSTYSKSTALCCKLEKNVLIDLSYLERTERTLVSTKASTFSPWIKTFNLRAFSVCAHIRVSNAGIKCQQSQTFSYIWWQHWSQYSHIDLCYLRNWPRVVTFHWTSHKSYTQISEWMEEKRQHGEHQKEYSALLQIYQSLLDSSSGNDVINGPYIPVRGWKGLYQFKDQACVWKLFSSANYKWCMRLQWWEEFPCSWH